MPRTSCVVNSLVERERDRVRREERKEGKEGEKGFLSPVELPFPENIKN